MEISINNQELQDKTSPTSKEPVLFKDDAGILYEITRYVPIDSLPTAEELVNGANRTN